MTTCEWPVDRTCLAELPAADADDYAEAVRQQNNATDLAVQVIWSLSGRQFGACTAIARPCPQPRQVRWFDPVASAYDQTVQPFLPVFEYGHWVNYPCGCVGRCEQGGPNVVHLPGPVQSIVTVTVGGVVLDPAVWVQEGDLLYRRDAGWPMQNYNHPAGAFDTWTVEYLKGNPVPPGVDRLTGMLAQEFITACSGGKCRLPKTVVSTTRQGVSHVFDPSRMLMLGFTGLTEVDSWLAAVNPSRLTAAPRVR